MADYTINFQAVGTNNPYTIVAPLTKLSTQNFRTDASGIRAADNSANAQLVHDVAYGTTIQSRIVIGTPAFSSDDVAAGIYVRSGANQKAGYVGYHAGTEVHIYRISAAGAATDLAGVGGVTALAGDTVDLVYITGTGGLTLLLNGVSTLTATDATFAAEPLGAGLFVGPGNINAQYIRSFEGTGVSAAGGQAARSSSFFRNQQNNN